MQSVLDWLAALPPVTLYLMMFFAAGIENVFPPLPSDTVVAFGSFLASRGNGTLIGAFLATWAGNLAGASLMYGAGRRYGAERVERRFFGKEDPAGESRLKSMYDRYGMFALFMSRFIPGVRALVPPFAGALRLPFARALVVMGVASGIWYGIIAVLAFRVGANWDHLQHLIGTSSKIAAAVALLIVLIVVAIRLVAHFRAPERDSTQ